MQKQILEIIKKYKDDVLEKRGYTTRATKIIIDNERKIEVLEQLLKDIK